MSRLELTQVTKVFAGGHQALDAVDLAVADGELLSVLGPSGSGKSTLLRVVAGLEEATRGQVQLDGRPIDHLPPHERNLAMVFQTPAVYPHLSVFANIAFGLRNHDKAGHTRDEQVKAAAELLHIGGLLERRPKALSGGERQRVAIARAIARRPGLLLLDEPFSNLDAPLRAAIRADLVALHRRLGTTTLFVAHDQAEALAIGDRVAVLDAGRLVQIGTPREVYERPATCSVARFLGAPAMNLLPADMTFEDDGAMVVRVAELAIGRVTFGQPWTAVLEARRSGAVIFGIRPEYVAVEQPGGPEWFACRGTIDRLEPTGRETWATVLVGPHPVTVRLPAAPAQRVGDDVTLSFDPVRAVWFDPVSGARLG